MKKTEAISILAASVRPREPKDRARYDEAVKMAIEALKCSETPKSSERTAEIAQDVKDEDLISRKVAMEAICTEGTRLERNGTTAMVEIKQWCVDILEALPSAQPEQHLCRDCKWAKYYGNVDKNGNVESYWYCTNWYGGTDEEGYCHEWESR